MWEEESKRMRNREIVHEIQKIRVVVLYLLLVLLLALEILFGRFTLLVALAWILFGGILFVFFIVGVGRFFFLLV